MNGVCPLRDRDQFFESLARVVHTAPREMELKEEQQSAILSFWPHLLAGAGELLREFIETDRHQSGRGRHAISKFIGRFQIGTPNLKRRVAVSSLEVVTG